MEKQSSNTFSTSFSSLATLLGMFIVHGFFDWDRIEKSYTQFRFNVQAKVELIFGQLTKGRSEKKNTSSELINQKVSVSEKGDDGKLSREDVETVMGRIGLVCSQHSQKLQERLSLDDLSSLFEEKEPSVEEVKGAFEVFDMNRDGFVDATELQRVLCSLGCQEGLKLEDCERMIRAFDENRDGRIDFNEFVKLMESSFC